MSTFAYQNRGKPNQANRRFQDECVTFAGVSGDKEKARNVSRGESMDFGCVGLGGWFLCCAVPVLCELVAEKDDVCGDKRPRAIRSQACEVDDVMKKGGGKYAEKDAARGIDPQ
ncbi:uncharacterized protein MEPE_03433 [Melanopsichium pennsylvanicum]|uniref:Uncharacterized protein n=1 Tax=Melanopsichium pennsylvanicum TaxID=63383 RepID=A0AAJ4XLU1_9BASI|nr:uncharacterized protein MEPE_03433 [Melanopsichium pennsylvanicum]